MGVFSQTGGQLARFIQDTKEAGGPDPDNYAALSSPLTYWSNVAEFWKARFDKYGQHLPDCPFGTASYSCTCGLDPRK